MGELRSGFVSARHPKRRFVVVGWVECEEGAAGRAALGEMTCTTVRDVKYGSGTSSLAHEWLVVRGVVVACTKFDAGSRRIRVQRVGETG